MKRILSSVLAVGVWMTPVTVTLMAQPGWGQSQESQVEEVQRLLQQAVQQMQRGQPVQAIETFQQVIAIARQLSNRKLESEALLGLGRNYQLIKNYKQSLYYYNLALMIFREDNVRLGEAIALNNIGSVNYEMRELLQALEFHNLALNIFREDNIILGEAATLDYICAIHDDMGKLEQALDCYNQSLPIFREVNDRLKESITLNNIGKIHYDMGELQQALDYYNEALPIAREIKSHSGEANILTNIGAVYNVIGKVKEALDYYRQALPIHREVQDRLGEAATLNNIGNLLNIIGTDRNDMGKLEQALNYYNKSLAILRTVNASSEEASVLNNVGKLHHDMGKLKQALDYYNQALAIHRKVGTISGQARTLSNIGAVHYDMEKPQEALNSYNQALAILRKVGDPSSEATILSNIAAVYRDTNRPDEAIAYWESSIEITLEMRGGLQRENRKPFLQLGSRRGSVVALLDILIDQNKPDLAFAQLNLATTFDLADYTRLINAKVRNPEAQRLIDQWNQTYQRIQFLYWRLEDNPSNQLSQRINDLWAENNQLAEDISRRFPEVAELFETKPVDIAKLKANIPEGTVLIQPVLLTNIENVPNNIAIFVLTANEPTQVTKVKIDPREFDKLLTQYRKQLENPREGSWEFGDNQKQLYDYLIRPVEAQIQAASPKQLAIIATGKLRYIPFETLYDREKEQHLIEKYPISYRTRISAREKSSEKQASEPARLLALGIPVFSGPQHLPKAEEEARKIHEIMPGKLLLGFHATLGAFKLQAPQSQLLHLATHGCFQKGGCPKLQMEENTLLFADRKLNIRDAALLGLENVDLIALSACQTAMEADSNGEEIAGLAYIFERAGAGAVMASLWNAHDGTTKEIMVEFYQHLKDGKMSKAEALQKAKLTQIYKYQHHSSWSPFILIGDGS